MRRFAALARALSFRNYRLFVAGQSISLIGTWMQQLGFSWLVYELTRSEFRLGLVSALGQLPTFFLAPVAGVLSDQLNRRRTLLVTQSVAMTQAIILVALIWSGEIRAWHLILLAMVFGTVNAFDLPTRQSFLFEMVPDRSMLPNAIAINSSMVNSARLIGPFVAGVVIANWGVLTCFTLNALSFVAVLAALLAMRELPIRPLRPRGSMRRGLAEGLVYAFGFAPIRALLLLLAVVSVMGMPLTVLLPAFAVKYLHGDAVLLGYLTGSAGCGALTSALVLAARKSVVGLGKRIVMATLVFGCGMIGFAYSRNVFLSCALLYITGFTMMFQMAACNMLLQTIVDDDKRGRIMSLYTVAFMGMAPLGSLLGGTMAEAVGAPIALTFGGLCCLMAATVFAWYLPALRAQVQPIYERIGIVQATLAVQNAADLRTPPE